MSISEEVRGCRGERLVLRFVSPQVGLEAGSDFFFLTFQPESPYRMSSTAQLSGAVISFAIELNGLHQSAFAGIMLSEK